MKILLAIDGSPHSQSAVSAVASRPWPDGSLIEVLNVVHATAPLVIDPALAFAAAHVQQEQEQRQAASTIVDAAVEYVGARVPNVALTAQVLEGNPKDVIVHEADALDADLIVLGSHGHGRLRRMVLGSVAGAVVANAPCSVHVVRDKSQVAQYAA